MTEALRLTGTDTCGPGTQLYCEVIMTNAVAIVTVVFAAVLGQSLLCGGEQNAYPRTTQVVQQNKLNEFMQEKQKLSHEVFDAIVLKDFKRIRKNASALTTLSQAATFQVHKTPRYLQHVTEFQDAVEKMAKNARDENADGVTLAFTEMTLSCVHCHDYIRGVKAKE